MELPIIKLREKNNKRLESGHWWIFSNELEEVNKDIEKGAICKFAYSDGRACGVGFFNPNSLISGRLLVKNSFSLNENFTEERILRADNYRKNLNLGNSYRLFFGESDFIGGLIIDRYNDVFVVELMSAGADKLKEEVVKALYKNFSPKAVLIKRDHIYRNLEGLELKEDEIIGSMPENIFIEENGLKFKIDILKSQKTGWYFDQRENRSFLIPYFKGRKVMDLYCYSGSFSILASKSGADIVWGIDSSKLAIENAIENMKLNKITNEKVIFKEENSVNILDSLERGELPVKPDFILIDPPNFVRNKKNLNQAVKLYVKLLSKAANGVAQDGYIAFSTCSHHISYQIFNEIISKAAQITKRKMILLEYRSQAKDHPIIIGMPETVYLHFSLIKVI